MSDDAIDNVILAIEDLIEDMEFRRNPPGTWGGWEHEKEVRQRLKKALEIWKAEK